MEHCCHCQHEKKELKLEVGKTYKTRDGSLVKIIYALGPNKTDYSFVGIETQEYPTPRTYTSSGIFRVAEPSSMDLVEEVPGPAAPEAPAPRTIWVTELAVQRAIKNSETKVEACVSNQRLMFNDRKFVEVLE